MAEEIFDVVDEEDRVLGQAPRSEVHARGLLHRAASIFVFNSRGQLLLQKRSAAKDEFPLCYTASASGHLNAGESYDACAPRELKEELGLGAPLERLQKFAAGPETANEHTVLYRTFCDELPDFDEGEIESVGFFDLAEIDAMLATSPEQFAPPFRVMFSWYARNCATGQAVD
jgi:16S rRNA (adenine1518-N6/adenine1519-N6)-dimethyltransferase